ncbi:MAG: HD domain-containing protein [bacterium]|nr:HD domain-containing protein [bacterium]
MNEEVLLETALDRYRLSDRHRISIRGYLDKLYLRDEATWRHSIRVGDLASRIGDFFCDCSGRSLLWAGLLHDIGKILVDPDLFLKRERFTDDDYRRMEPHVEYGWRMLRGIHEWTAHVIVRHHRYGARPYPARLPPMTLPGRTEERIDALARRLALADYYDALMTRDNAKFGKEPLSPVARREQYLRGNADQEPLILRLEAAGILQFSA